MNEYALYKGEEIIAIGTVNEIAEQLGVKTKTVRKYHTPTHKKKIEARKQKKGARVLVKLEGDDEDE